MDNQSRGPSRRSLRARIISSERSYGNLDHYENDAAETVILANGKPAVELSFQFELEFGPQWFDRVFPQLLPPLWPPRQGREVLRRPICHGPQDNHLDTQGGSYFNGFNPHNQMTVYTIASQTIMKSPIKGVIIDAVQIAIGLAVLFVGITYRTNDQLERMVGRHATMATCSRRLRRGGTSGQ